MEHGQLELAGQVGAAPEDLVTTGSDGRFVLRAPEPGMWTVRLELASCVPIAYRLEPLLDDVQLPPVQPARAAVLQLLVRAPEGAPVPGARLRLTGIEEVPQGWLPAEQLAITGPDGTVTLLVAGPMRLTVTARGFAGQQLEVQPGEHRVVLARGATLGLTVFDHATQKGVAGALVEVGADPWVAGLTDTEGTLELTLPPGLDVPLRVSTQDGRFLLTSGTARPGDWKARVWLPPPHEVAGRVLDAVTRTPLAGALVWPRNHPASFLRTDAEGRYRWFPREERDWELLAESPGYAGAAARYQRQENTPQRGPTLVLNPAPGRLWGRVVDSRGDPVAGARIRADLVSARRLVHSATDGSFELLRLPSHGALRLAVQQDGFQPAHLTLDLQMDRLASQRLEIVLLRLRSAFGSIVDPQGNLVAGARVELANRPRAAALAAVLSDEQGRFVLPEVSSHPYQLTVAAQGYATLRRPFTAPPGESPLDLGEWELAEAVALAGRVTDADDRPLRDAWIYASPAPGHGMNTQEGAWGAPAAVSGEDGTFTLADLEKGIWQLKVEKEGYLPRFVPEISVPGPEPLTVILERAAQVNGRVYDPQGNPVANAEVAILQPGTHPDLDPLWALTAQATRSDVDGYFTLPDLTPGTICMVAEARGFQRSLPVTLAVAPGDALEGVELRLRPAAQVEGRVLTAVGDPAVAASVRAFPPQDLEASARILTDYVETDGDGYFQLEDIAPGSQMIEVVLVNHPRLLEAVAIQPGHQWLELRLDPVAVHDVAGTVVDVAGEPLADVALALVPYGRPGRPLYGRSAVDGSFDFEHVSEGTYRLEATLDGYLQRPLVLEIAGQDVREVIVELFPATTIRVHLPDLDASERDLAEVYAEQNGWYLPARITGTAGTFIIPHLPPGTWQVRARIRGSQRQAQATIVVENPGSELDLDLRLGEP